MLKSILQSPRQTIARQPTDNTRSTMCKKYLRFFCSKEFDEVFLGIRLMLKFFRFANL